MKTFIGELQKIMKILENEPMKNHTTFKIGGPARYMAEVSSEEELSGLLKVSKEFGVKPLVIGRGSNLLVSDEGIDTLVIKLGNGFSKAEVSGNEIYAMSGISLSALSQLAAENSLTGLEFASGIPGTLGGAVYMNAGAYGGEMKDVVVESFYMDESGERHSLKNHEFGYRKSFYSDKSHVITFVKLSLEKGNKEEIKQKMAELSAKRREKQPVNMPSAGSVFKRPEGYFAGALIEEAGLKGFAIGGAEVSQKHAGFIVNRGGATSEDVLALIEHIKKTVYERNGVMLETEVKTIKR